MTQLRQRWPGLGALPEDFAGFFAHNAGVVKAREGLQACKRLSIEQGADLRYGQVVKAVDTERGTVTLQDGKVLKAKHIVVCCGAFTDQFYSKGTFEM